MEFSVVVPLYNEENSLQALNGKICKVMEALAEEYEIIYVDDGSCDSSLDILKELKLSFPQLKIISFKENQGQSVALFAGFIEARGRWIVTLDADLQNPPEEIIKLLKYRKDFDFITGIRKRRKDVFLRRISSLIAKFFRWVVLGDRTKDVGCSLRLFRRQIIDFLPFFRNFHRFLPFLVRLSGFKVKEVEVLHQPRRFGKSKYGVWRRAKEGLFDLVGLFWLKRRIIKYEIKYRD